MADKNTKAVRYSAGLEDELVIREPNDVKTYTPRAEKSRPAAVRSGYSDRGGEVIGVETAVIPKLKTTPKKKKRRVNPVKRTLIVIGTTLLSLVLLVIITGSIVAAALTLYILQFRDPDIIDIDIYKSDIAYSSFIYGYDENGGLVELAKINRVSDRIPVTLDKIPRHVQDAFVYTEDERFYEHDGVDWQRTFSAFLNEFLGMWGFKFGGSTITQQLVKNITGEEEQNWERKMREIFRASNLEQYKPKPEILESYLNYIGFGGNTDGVQAAALKYFGKDISELSIAEGACLAAIPKSPNSYNPHANFELNMERQRMVLGLMYKNAVISEKQYEDALAEKIVVVDPNAPKEDGSGSGIQSWFVDMVIRDVTYDLMKLHGKTYEEANDMLYNGGYEVYTTVDLNMQAELEAKFANWETFSAQVVLDRPQASAICLDYMGNVKAVVGGVGDKAGSNIFVRADRAQRSPGSTIKPITSYSYAIEHDLITWSTIFTNKPLDNIKGDDGALRQWPYNYNSKSWDYGSYFTFQALQRSLNTVPAQLVQQATPIAVFEFLQSKYQISTLSPYDVDLAPLSIGSLTNGMTLKEIVAAYQVFGNAGMYYPPTTYTKVLESTTGKVVLQHKYIPIQSISKESAYVMNKLMQTVIEGPNGTGRAAKLNTVTVVGKTGTSQDWHDLSFIGCTPDYVSGIWYGYDTPKAMQPNPYYSSAQVWKNVFGEMMENYQSGKQFPANNDVKELYYCTRTGLIAGGRCPTGAIGYYKSTNIPLTCGGNHAQPEQSEQTDLE